MREKWLEARTSVLPIAAIVLILCLTLIPVPSGAMMGFVVGAVMIMLGMAMFTLGTDMAMTPIGEQAGRFIAKSKKRWVVLLIGFLVGVLVTVSEPDLNVLAGQVPGVANLTLILAVALGVGLFLAVALMRILLRIKMKYLLLGAYSIVFALGFFVPDTFLAVAFDSGGVTTGPMTVPFILALGVGVSALRSDPDAENDSFGLVALCSVGPITAVMLLGLICKPGTGESTAAAGFSPDTSLELSGAFLQALPAISEDVALALSPIVLMFILMQVLHLKLPRASLMRILIGIAYTYIGLVLFLMGANVGFMPVGYDVGRLLGSTEFRWVLVPIGMLIGYFVVRAEPAVHVLSKQVYDLTAGAVPKKALSMSLSVGVAVSVGLAMLRSLLSLPLLWLLIPGYLIALALMFFVPPLFTSIAFDSGGVASGPMTATFLLPLAMGACAAVGGDAAADAFGVVSMVAMTPLIAIQALGLRLKLKHTKVAPTAERVPESETIIELDEEDTP